MVEYYRGSTLWSTSYTSVLNHRYQSSSPNHGIVFGHSRLSWSNSWSSCAKWHPRCGPTLDEVTSCYLRAPSRYLIGCWHLISNILRTILRMVKLLLLIIKIYFKISFLKGRHFSQRPVSQIWWKQYTRDPMLWHSKKHIPSHIWSRSAVSRFYNLFAIVLSQEEERQRFQDAVKRLHRPSTVANELNLLNQLCSTEALAPITNDSVLGQVGAAHVFRNSFKANLW